MPWSSEAHKMGIVPPKPPEEMTPEELKEWRNSLDPDMMGFDGAEYEEGAEDVKNTND
jgi:hypothetical protein